MNGLKKAIRWAGRFFAELLVSVSRWAAFVLPGVLVQILVGPTAYVVYFLAVLGLLVAEGLVGQQPRGSTLQSLLSTTTWTLLAVPLVAIYAYGHSIVWLLGGIALFFGVTFVAHRVVYGEVSPRQMIAELSAANVFESFRRPLPTSQPVSSVVN